MRCTVNQTQPKMYTVFLEKSFCSTPHMEWSTVRLTFARGMPDVIALYFLPGSSLKTNLSVTSRARSSHLLCLFTCDGMRASFNVESKRSEHKHRGENNARQYIAKTNSESRHAMICRHTGPWPRGGGNSISGVASPRLDSPGAPKCLILGE